MGVRGVSELFYIPPEDLEDGRVTFPYREGVHISRSCRKGVGDRIQVTDGTGTLITVQIREVGDRVRGEVLGVRQIPHPPFQIDLAVGVSSRERMGWLVEKSTELGMTAFIPLITAWSKAKRNRDEWKGHIERWKRVGIAAIKQSGRYFLPQIHTPLPLCQFLDTHQFNSYDLRLLLDPGREGTLVGDLLENEMKRFIVVIGPEGGFNCDEIDRITGKGFLRGRLMGRPLRFETAGISALALIAEWLERETS
jgi:16S rRNA (uracil1498-N3)-methyltransferase